MERRASAPSRTTDVVGPTLEVLEGLLGHASDLVAVVNVEGILTYVSPAVPRFFGLEVEDVVGRPAGDFTHPDDYDRLFEEASNQILGMREPAPIVYRQRGPDGEYRHVESQVIALPADHPLGVAIINTRDISDRVASEQAFAESQRVVRMVAEGESTDRVLDAICGWVERRAPGTSVAISHFDADTSALVLAAGPSLPGPIAEALAHVQLASGAAAAQASVSFAEDIETDPACLHLHPLAAQTGLHSAWSTPIRSTDGVLLGTVAVYGTEPSCLAGAVVSLLAEAADLVTIAMARRHSEAVLAFHSSHDVLTSLPNRALVFDRLGQALARRRRYPEDDVAVMFVDLDRFKEVNDRYGHTVGDAVLCEAAQRLRTTLREIDTVGRFGGDEFLVVAHTADARVLASRINSAIAQPLEAMDTEISCSIGIAIAGNEDTPESLVVRADHELLRAKQRGRDCYVLEPASR